MSRKLFAFLLSELRTVRFRCVGCATVTELAIDKVPVRLEHPKCPVCGAAWSPYADNHLAKLAAAVEGLRGRADAVEVEFVVPDTGD